VRRTAPAFAVAVAQAIATGCVRYEAVAGGAVPTGRPVRVQLTDLATATLAPTLGAGVVAVDGRVSTRDDTGLVLAAVGTVVRNGDTQPWQGEPVRLAWRDVARVQTPRTDVARTALSALAVVGGAVALGAALSRSSSGGGGRGGTGVER
jgi:hypothetical protein